MATLGNWHNPLAPPPSGVLDTALLQLSTCLCSYPSFSSVILFLCPLLKLWYSPEFCPWPFSLSECLGNPVQFHGFNYHSNNSQIQSSNQTSLLRFTFNILLDIKNWCQKAHVQKWTHFLNPLSIHSSLPSSLLLLPHPLLPYLFSCTIFGPMTKARNLESSKKSHVLHQTASVLASQLFYHFKFPWINYFPRAGSHQLLVLSTRSRFLLISLLSKPTHSTAVTIISLTSNYDSITPLLRILQGFPIPKR